MIRIHFFQHTYIVILSFFALGLLSSCESKQSVNVTTDNITEGVLEYVMEYPYLDSNDIGLKLLPESMVLTFKDDKYRSETVGGMGLFVAGFVSDNENKVMDYYMKMLSTKYITRFTTKGVEKFNSKFPAFRTEKLDATKTIAGLKCYGVKIIFYDNPVDDYVVWYTKDIKMSQPNWCNPYKSIDGVLMQYTVQREGLVARMTATNLILDKITVNEMKLPLDYKVVSNKKLIRKMEEAFLGFDY